MFAIAFDLMVAETAANHPKGIAQAYSEIAGTLGNFGFERVQGSVYVTAGEDMANLFQAISALEDLPWLAASVRDIRAFDGSLSTAQLGDCLGGGALGVSGCQASTSKLS